MIDIKLLLNDFDNIAKMLTIKKVPSATLDILAARAQKYKSLKIELEEKQAFANKTSKEFGILLRDKADKSKIDALKLELEDNKNKMLNLQNDTNELQEKLEEILHSIPNVPDSLTPIGDDEKDNVEVKKVGEIPHFDFAPKEHWELAQNNGWIDFEAGVKLAKSRFSVLRGMGAKLNRALIEFMLDCNQKAGFEMIVTPAIVNDKMLFGTGQLPKFANDMFKISNEGFDEDDTSKRELYLISTSEITLTNLYNDVIIPIDNLPILLTSQTPCFRKEAGSAGRDTRGIIRQHQFDKVELVAITHPDKSEEIKQKMIDTASSILSALKLPHRMVQLCGGDLGFSASNTIDIEVWLPGQNCYREISSISNTRDFQARRAKIRYKDSNGKNYLAHTLNGSSLAVGRTLVAIMENYQLPNGDIAIPEVLKSYIRI